MKRCKKFYELSFFIIAILHFCGYSQKYLDSAELLLIGFLYGHGVNLFLIRGVYK